VLLEVENLTVAYRSVEAVHGVSLGVKEGELVSVIGANGAGKTTILRTIMGLQSQSGGAITFAGRDISRESTHLRARSGVRMVPERARIFPQLSVLENLMTGVFGMRHKIPLKERMSRLYSLFPILKERSDQMGSTLSGGEQQQLSIARACISVPRLLLVDEVSMGLMPRLADQVFELLKQLNREEGLTILLVEQNADASLRISNRAYVLETGNIVLEGKAGNLLEDERVKEAYLGL